MIADFDYREHGDPNAITIQMLWDADSRSARVNLPARLQTWAQVQSIDVPDEVMTLESAIAYAIFLAMKENCRLVLSGDRSVWNAEWGHLQISASRMVI